MHSPALASRRFYNAFYVWHTLRHGLPHPPPPVTSSGRVNSHRYDAFHTSIRATNSSRRPTCGASTNRDHAKRIQVSSKDSRAQSSVRQQRLSASMPLETKNVAATEHAGRGRGKNRSMSSPETTRADQLATDLKATLRALTHPVVLITSRLTSPVSSASSKSVDATASPSLSQCRGVTVSSFNTITLSPVPMVSFNLKRPSRTWDAMESSRGRICVHVLAASPEGAAVADIFTRPYDEAQEPFEKLAGLGARVVVQDEGVGAPQIVWARPSHTAAGSSTISTPPILARISAMVHTDKCVSVGDHVVVVAEVEKVEVSTVGEKGGADGGEGGPLRAMEILESLEGLAYARRGYRGLGPGVEIVRVPEPAERKSQHSRDDGIGEDRHGRPPISKSQQKSTQRMIEEEEGEYDLGFAPPEATKVAAATDDGRPATSQSTFVSRASRFANPNQRRSLHTWSVQPARKTQSRSTLVRPLESRRRYSTTPARLSEKNIRDKVTSPALLRQTVGEFLYSSTDRPQPRRMGSILKTQAEAEQALRRLQQGLSDGTLTPEASAELEETVARSERSVARALATGAAADLGRMLDTGAVTDVRQAQWLESAIEKGQAVLLDEARLLREKRGRGEVDGPTFESQRAVLEDENRVLVTEALRLRSMVDEEGEGSGGD